MKKDNISLTTRLQKIAELVPPSKMLADIGTDHAYLPIYLIKNKQIERAIASDIKKGPLLRADENIKKYQLEKFVDTRLGAGLKTIKPEEAETIVIAGMGGILISDILNASPETVSEAKVIILQPMTAVKELREFLCENNFGIDEEYVVAEENKLYNILKVTPNKQTSYTPKEIYFGRGIEKTSSDLYEKYKEGIIKKLKKRISGLSKSCLPENVSIKNELKQVLEILTDEEK